MFEWDESTNKLSMKAGRDEPWIFHSPPPSQAECTWKYCTACFDRWASKSKANRSFVTFRDKASQVPRDSRRTNRNCFVTAKSCCSFMHDSYGVTL